MEMLHALVVAAELVTLTPAEGGGEGNLLQLDGETLQLNGEDLVLDGEV